MQVETWILAVLGIGVGFIGWIAITVLQIKFAGIQFSTSIKKDIESFSEKVEGAVSDIKKLFEHVKLVDKHDTTIENLTKQTKVHGRNITGVEKFLSKKHGNEFYETYEKYKSTDS